MEAEEERKKKEAEEADRLRREQMEADFDTEGELKKLGGKVFDFFVDDGKLYAKCLMFIRNQEKSAL